MTSWIRTSRRTVEETPRPYFLSLGNDEFCAHFNTLFYSHTYAKSMSRDLVIYDKSTAISPSYSLLEETFAPINRVSYSSEMRALITILRAKDSAKFFPLLSKMNIQELRTEARAVLVWKPSMMEKIRSVVEENSLPDTFDVGVHIRFPKRFDTVRAPSVQTYVDAVSGEVSVENPNVFVMADQSALLEEFRRLAPSKWIIHAVYPANSLLRGSSIDSFNRQSLVGKLRAYSEYVTELYCMQNCSKLICNLSTDAGRFLFLTGNAEKFRSMDTPEWSPF